MNTLEREVLELALRTDLATFTHRTFQTVAPAQVYHHNWLSKPSPGICSNALKERSTGL